MDDSELQGFAVQLKHLYHAYSKRPSPDAVEMWFGIMRRRQVPLSTFKRAVILAVEREKFLPRIPTMLQYCDVARERQSARQLTAGPESDALRWCPVCDDTGWEPFYCLGIGHVNAPQNFRKYELKECGMTTQHFGHSWVRACECRPTNPVYTRNHPVRPKTFAEGPGFGDGKPR